MKYNTGWCFYVTCVYPSIYSESSVDYLKGIWCKYWIIKVPCLKNNYKVGKKQWNSHCIFVSQNSHWNLRVKIIFKRSVTIRSWGQNSHDQAHWAVKSIQQSVNQSQWDIPMQRGPSPHLNHTDTMIMDFCLRTGKPTISVVSRPQSKMLD